MDEHTTALARRLQDRMEREAELFARLGLEVERLRESFQGKKWTAGLTIAQGIEQYAAKVEEADTARDGAFMALRDALGLPRETAFSAMLPRLPAADMPPLPRPSGQ